MWSTLDDRSNFNVKNFVTVVENCFKVASYEWNDEMRDNGVQNKIIYFNPYLAE